MTDYKLVPVEPTLDMLSEGMEVYCSEDCAEADVLGIYKAMLAAAPDHIPDTGKKVSRTQIREVFLRNGFTIKPGHDDLKDYVYAAAYELLQTAPAVQGEPEPPVTVVTDEMVEAVQRIRETAMRWTLVARIPECGEFGGIAQDAGWLLGALRAAEQQPCPEGIRDGAPYDDPVFEALCRENEIWGTAAAAQCAVFWEAGKRAAEQQPALTKYQPCGCVLCTCEHETQCQGCGANHCGTHPVGQIPGPVYQQPAPDVAGLVEAASAALDEIEAIMREAYNSAEPVCCGRRGAGGCCGSPEPEWSEIDQNTIGRLWPHQRALTAALSAYRKKRGGVIHHE